MSPTSVYGQHSNSSYFTRTLSKSFTHKC